MGDSRNGMRARPGAWARWIVRVGMPVACASSLAAQRPPVGAAVGVAGAFLAYNAFTKTQGPSAPRMA